MVNPSQEETPYVADPACLGMQKLGYAACLCAEQGAPTIPLKEGVIGGAPCIDDRQERLEAALERAEADSTHDDLTGLLNTRAMRTEFDRRAAAGEKFGVLYLDVQNFKQINETGSHLAGDYALQFVANVLNLQLRAEDAIITTHDTDEVIIHDPKSKASIVYRKGGDEFIIFMGGSDIDESVMQSIEERVSTAFAKREETIAYNNTNPDYPTGLTTKSFVYDPENPVPIETVLKRGDPKVEEIDDLNPVLLIFRGGAERTAKELAARDAERDALAEQNRRLDDPS